MICMGDYEPKPTYKNFVYIYIYFTTNNVLENRLMYLNWAFQFNVINASTTYENINHE